MSETKHTPGPWCAELLEALEKALDALGGNDPYDLCYDDSICGYIRAAIAKAKGEQP